jgi:protein-tyrosine phosphatase
MTTFSIMFVCTGNMCRSPVAERLAVATLKRHLPADAATAFQVSSAGTGTFDGREMTPEAAAVVSAYDGDPEGFRSTELTAELVGAADLILTATRAHRSAVVTLDPGALRRSFTLTEFARTTAVLPDRVRDAVGTSGAPAPAPADAAEVADAADPIDESDSLPGDPVERARAVVALIARRRGTVRPTTPDEDDIPDPIGRPMAVYEAAGATIAHAVTTSITALVGPRA